MRTATIALLVMTLAGLPTVSGCGREGSSTNETPATTAAPTPSASAPAPAPTGLKYGEKAGYIDINDPDMLVHTPLAKPGETSDVTFTAPEPGTYPYICTVPGHYLMMKGVLTVAP
jgi:hypothetical protein